MTTPDAQYRPIRVFNGQDWVYVGDPRLASLADRLDALTGGSGSPGVGLDDATVADGQLTLYLTDGTTRGPFPVRGTDGAAGPPGPPGDEGPRGVAGQDGAPGAKGDKGDPTFVTTQAGLAAALAAGGDIHVDTSVTIALTATQNITRPTRLIGGRFTRATGEAFRITSSNVELDGLTIDGGGGTTYEASQKLIRAVGASSSRLTGINIHDCVLSNSRADCIWLEWCDGARVAGNTIRTFLYSGIEIISGASVRVSDNDVTDGRLTATQVYGIAFSDFDNTAAARSFDCIAIGNRVHLVDWEGIDTHGGDSISIVGNIITGCPRGIALISGNASRLMQPQRCVVSGNRIDGTGMRQAAREGIILAGLAGKPADAVITGNLIDNYTTPFLLDLWDRALTYVGGNVPPLQGWAPITMDGDWNAHATVVPQYRVDGNTVHIRGAVVPKAANSTRGRIGRIPIAAAWPSGTFYVAPMRASNTAGGQGWITVDSTGVLSYTNFSGTDQFNYFLNGSYVVP